MKGIHHSETLYWKTSNGNNQLRTTIWIQIRVKTMSRCDYAREIAWEEKKNGLKTWGVLL